MKMKLGTFKLWDFGSYFFIGFNLDIDVIVDLIVANIFP